MAYGNEIWLGYIYPEYHEKAPADAPRLPWPYHLRYHLSAILEEFPDQMFEYAKKHQSALIDAWIASGKELGWDNIGKRVPRSKSGRMTARTPAGAFEFYPFDLQCDFAGEMEFIPPDVPIGVALSGRYCPTYLDYRDPSGTLPNPLLLDDPERTTMIAIARKHISAALPWLSDAKLMLVERHY